MRLKKFFTDTNSDQNNSDNSAKENLDFNSEQNISRPMTRALKKLIDHKNAAQLALMYSAICPKSIAPCVNGNKNVQTIHYFLTQTLLANTSKNANHG